MVLLWHVTRTSFHIFGMVTLFPKELRAGIPKYGSKQLCLLDDSTVAVLVFLTFISTLGLILISVRQGQLHSVIHHCGSDNQVPRLSLILN